jgi:hypothetical protein
MTIRENAFPYSRKSADGKDNRGKMVPLFSLALSNLIRGINGCHSGEHL